MKYSADSPIDYIDQLPEERKKAFNKLRKTVLDNIPKGYEECMNYGMLGYVVPKSIYPAGYHCDPKLPLPFTNIASQKNFIALYHMGIYAVIPLSTLILDVDSYFSNVVSYLIVFKLEVIF